MCVGIANTVLFIQCSRYSTFHGKRLFSPAAESAELPCKLSVPSPPRAAGPGPLSGRVVAPGRDAGQPQRRRREPRGRLRPGPGPRPARPAAPLSLPPPGGRSAAPQGASAGLGPRAGAAARGSVQPRLRPQRWGFPVGNPRRCSAVGGGSRWVSAACPRWVLFLPGSVAASMLRQP